VIHIEPYTRAIGDKTMWYFHIDITINVGLREGLDKVHIPRLIAQKSGQDEREPDSAPLYYLCINVPRVDTFNLLSSMGAKPRFPLDDGPTGKPLFPKGPYGALWFGVWRHGGFWDNLESIMTEQTINFVFHRRLKLWTIRVSKHFSKMERIRRFCHRKTKGIQLLQVAIVIVKNCHLFGNESCCMVRRC